MTLKNTDGSTISVGKIWWKKKLNQVMFLL